MTTPRTDADICNMALLFAGLNQRIGSLTDGSAAAQACNSIYAEKRRSLLGEFKWPFAIRRQQLTPYSGSAYDATRTYAQGDLSTFGNNTYRSLLAANLNHQPDQNASAGWWAQVTRDGYAYVCPLPPDCLDPLSIWEKLSVSGQSVVPLWIFSKPDVTYPNLRNPRSMDRPPFTLENANDGTDERVLLTDLDTPVLRYVYDLTNPSAFTAKFAEALAWALSGPLAMGLRGDEKKAEQCERRARLALAEAITNILRGQQEDEEPVSEFEAAREGSP